MSTLHLSPAEHDALDRLLDAFLRTETHWHILTHLHTIRDKLHAQPPEPERNPPMHIQSNQLVTVTPAQAREWLATISPNYRPVSDANVAQLAKVMTDGQWSEDPWDPIVIDATYRVRGGRMRLLAVVDSGVEVPMWVEQSPPVQRNERQPALYDPVDPGTGRPRGGPRIQAMRYDGGNAADIRQWVSQEPGQVTEVSDDGHGWLRLLTGGGGDAVQWCHPGDWVGRRPQTGI